MATAKKPANTRRRVASSTFIQRSRSISPERKAFYHQVEGAGPRHVLRPFLGLTHDEAATIDTRISTLIDAELSGRT